MPADGKHDEKQTKKPKTNNTIQPNRNAERKRNRQLNLAQKERQKAKEAQKAKYAQKRRERRAATTAARIARTDFPPSPSPSTSSSSDVPAPLPLRQPPEGAPLEATVLAQFVLAPRDLRRPCRTPDAGGRRTPEFTKFIITITHCQINKS